VSTGGHTIPLEIARVDGPSAAARVAALAALAVLVFVVTAGIAWALTAR
jgi:hypothetical protein